MHLTLMAVLAALAAGTLTPRTVEQDGIRIEVSVNAHVYTWTVHNLSAPPIVRIELRPHNSYNYQGPPGWQVQEGEDRVFRAWTDALPLAIKPGESSRFEAQVTSSGAALGAIPIALGLEPATATAPAGDATPAAGRTVRFPAVWGPIQMPRSSILAVAATIVAIGLFHAAVARRRGRPHPAPGAGGDGRRR